MSTTVLLLLKENVSFNLAKSFPSLKICSLICLTAFLRHLRMCRMEWGYEGGLGRNVEVACFKIISCYLLRVGNPRKSCQYSRPPVRESDLGPPRYEAGSKGLYTEIRWPQFEWRLSQANVSKVQFLTWT